MGFFYSGLIALVILLLLILSILLYMKWRRAVNANAKPKCYRDLTDLIQKYTSLAHELKGPLREFFDLVKYNPDSMPEKHIAEEILQELVETDLLLKSKLKHARYIADKKVLHAVWEFLIPTQVRYLTYNELDDFLKDAIQKSKSIFRLMEMDFDIKSNP